MPANPFLPPPAPVSQQTVEQKMAAVQQQLVTDGRRLLTQMVNTVQRNWTAVWENADFTPPQFLAQLGPTAVDVFRSSAALTAALYAIAPQLLDAKYLSAKYPYTAHPDGTITIDEKK